MDIKKIPQLLIVALLLCISAFLLIQQNNRISTEYNNVELSQIGSTLSQQIALIAGPLILSEDWVSLNVALKQLTENPYIVSADIVNRTDEVLAQVGKPTDTVHQSSIQAAGNSIGAVRLYLDQDTLIHNALNKAATLNWFIAIAHLIILLGVYLTSRQRHGHPESSNNGVTSPVSEDTQRAWTKHSVSNPDESLVDDDELNADDPVTPPTGVSEIDFDLSIPDKGSFSVAEPKDLQLEAEDINQITADRGPIRYFVIFINCRQGSGHLLERETRDELLSLYQQLFERVCEIYRGAFSLDTEGNWLAQFPQEILKDNEADLQLKLHCGSNALCAAQLFKSLYRKLNQQRILQMKPVINLKIGLVAGEQPEILKQDAGVMTNRTESNEIITSEELYEFIELRNLLLASGVVTRAENGSYLIHQLAADFQQLIDRQAEHFLQSNPANSF